MKLRKIGGLLLSGLLAINTMFMPYQSYTQEITIDQKASLLNKINVLTGDGTSFQLNQKLKRGEAAAFMVKALGVQNLVLSNASQYNVTTFKDVPSKEWFAPYVGYCVKNGIISGFPDGSFKPNETLSEKAFYSMLLKALGYASQDFDWNTVYRKALDVGITKNMLIAFSTEDNSNFLRAGVVDSLYLAMSLKHKNSDRFFVENLITNNVITKEVAAQSGFIKVDVIKTGLSHVKMMDSKTIELLFTETIQPVPATEIKIYKFGTPSSLLSIIEATTVGNKLTIKTADPIPLQKYSVEVGNVLDSEGNLTNGFIGDYTTTAQAEIKSPYFKISKIDAINSKVIQVTFTHPITDKSETELLYSIYQDGVLFVEGGYKSIAVKKSFEKNNVITITLLNTSFVEGKKYDLRIRGDLVSTYQMNLNNGDGETMQFIAQAGQLPAIANLTSIYSQENKYVYLELSNKVDLVNAQNKLNYSIKEKDTNRLLTPSAVYLTKVPDKVGKQIVLKFDTMIATKEYELTARNMYSEYQAAKIPDIGGVFVAGAVTNQDLLVEYVQPVDKNTVYVYFNRELSQLSTLGSILIDNGITVSKKSLDSAEPKLLKVHLSTSTPLKSGAVYKISIYAGFQDFSERVLMKTITTEFAGLDNPKQNIGVDSAAFISSDKILIRFNQKIDAIQNNSTDKFEVYHSDGKNERLLIPSSVFIAEDGVAIIQLPLLMAGGSYTLKCKNIIDQTGYTTQVLNSMPISNEYFK